MFAGSVIVPAFNAFFPFSVRDVTPVFDERLTETEIGYSRVAPFAAVTLTTTVFSPLRRDALPEITALATASVGIATTSTEVVP